MGFHKSKGLKYHSVILLGEEDWPFRDLSETLPEGRQREMRCIRRVLSRKKTKHDHDRRRKTGSRVEPSLMTGLHDS
jgi:ATP-dependent exoDNAse (exonuclease V) beta subunit